MGFEYIESDISRVVSSLQRCQSFGLDLETTGLNPIDSRILLCQLKLDTGEEFVINVAKVPLDPILPFLSSNKYKKIIQNAKFEEKFFLYFYNTPIYNTWDTYLAELVIMPEGRGNSLAALSKKYLDIDLNKDTRQSFFNMRGSEFTQEQLEYGIMDVRVLQPIMDRQIAQVKEHGLETIVELEFELSNVVASMELTGAPVDVSLWKSKITEFEQRHENSRMMMHELLFDDGNLDEQVGMFERYAINLNSAKQVKDAFLKLGIKVDATNEREIALINHPAANELLEYRGFQKILTSYGSTFLEKVHPFTGCIHADFQQIGTETGRFSCKDPNLQQMPAEFRECIRKEGYTIVGADYSQIELRILAELSDDPAFISAFQSGNDLHKATASMMFRIPIDNVSKEQRFIAKTINFGISYGMGTTKLMDMLNAEAARNNSPKLSFLKVQDMMNLYHKTYNKVSEWLKEAGNSAFINGYSTTMLGRKRFYTRPDINAIPEAEYKAQVGAIKRKGANSPIQGTNADITKIAMVNLYDELQDAGFRANIIIQVHDEIVVLAQNSQAEEVKEVVVNSMKKSAAKIIKKVPIKADAYLAEAWKK